ncbi:phosphatidylinositol 4,5-bisphosphate 3-kinase catalytic subunit beta isoform-like isoform X1 [Haliotis cracherodii]|uniref:phosphatidylinositol 4,5-bisphosphate 3-kinase catalytic subunit beta isoform-like isoform X1 n=1 Tax=Haliotis cracherodii TaxID=6455 RepID=UPI0039EB6D1E
MPPIVVLADISSNLTDDSLSIDYLLPNGILIPIKTSFYKPFEIIKQELWTEAEKFPLFKLLKRSDNYCFVCVNISGEREEILDESQCLHDVRPYSAFLKLVEREGDERHKTLVRNINSLIGKDPQNVEAWQSAEVADFRSTMRQMCEKIVQDRNDKGWFEALMYKFPPRLRPKVDLPSKIADKLNNNIMVEVVIEESKSTFTIRLPGLCRPSELIQLVLVKLSRSGNLVDEPEQYLLKSFGIEEYIYGVKYPLQQYKYVYQCLVKNTAPQFLLVARETVIDPKPAVPPRKGSIANYSQIPTDRRGDDLCVWDLKERYYFTVRGINKVQLPDGAKVKLFMGLYHGSEALCGIKTTDEMIVQEGVCNMKLDVTFDIAARDLPQMARVCYTLCATGKKKDQTAVAWVNVAVFDFRSRLTRGDRNLPMWPWTDEMQTEEFLYPIGSVTPNAQGNEATTLLIKFPDFNMKNNIRYPAFDKTDPRVLECAAKNMEPSGAPGSAMMKVSKSHLEQLMMIVQRDSLIPLFEQDKELLWMMRYECCHKFPHALPKVLSSVKWNSHIDVAKMIAVLQTWPQLDVDYALQLLDFNYPDKNIRKFAVSCLDNTDTFSDEELSRYLLQLVQALKYETHLCCPLVEFLLTRALGNQHIGHQLFWLLKSEMYNPYVSVQYRLILEVYLVASGEHMMALHKQQEALGKLCVVNGLIKSERYNMGDQKSHEQAKKDMQAVLQQKTYQDILSNLCSPLSPLFRLRSLDIDKCKFMKSKKRPLWLVWKDEVGQDMSLIYKNGDDLRQDMLTLQMLEIMDNIWQSEGLDLRMNVYRCLATGQEQGVIEAVGQSQTIANIQKWFNRGAFDKKAVFEWLKHHHKTQESLDEAVEEFILSCAGYCVATYVLGIGDRHNDNIMLKQSGQLFHIDFGHFLGNFKSKFGVKRERVPFVLTTHFVYVIQKGKSNNSENFKRFQSTCEKAYLILRKKAPLLFSLFLMMLSSGIPQLTCTKDVDYLRETLKPDLTDEEAKAHFQTKFREALEKSWTTSINFYIHLMANN